MTSEHRSFPSRRHEASSAAAPTGSARPKRLLTQNSELKRIGVWNWSIPALAARLPDGRTIRTCPSAGVCADVCYARAGRYQIPSVRARHLANLRYVLEDPAGWEAAMTSELILPRFRRAWVRIHDAGDFFSDAYLAAWLRIIAMRPLVNFYAYTKEIDRFRRLVEPAPPSNFRWVYSYGGIQDSDLDPDVDRVADVFPTEEAIKDAGWHSQTGSDLLAVTGPAPVGIPANNIPRYRRRQGERTFGQWQAQAQRGTTHRRHATLAPQPDPRVQVDRSHTEAASRHCAYRSVHHRPRHELPDSSHTHRADPTTGSAAPASSSTSARDDGAAGPRADQ